MWKPPQRIRHAPPPGGWPSAAEAARSRWFSPVRVGPVELEQRTWVPAMVPWRATEEGFVTEDVLAWYERFARGKPGALVVEATGIREVPSGPLLRIGHDRFVAGLRELVETVRRASGGHTRLFIQIIDFLAIRRRPEAEKFFARFLALTDRHRAAVGAGKSDEEVRAALAGMSEAELEQALDERELEALRYGHRERVTDLDLPHVRELPRVLPELFATAAERARRAGFDGVELHYAHAYTMASFLSARNDRSDGYGGTRENRLRLPLEVYRRVRERVGEDFAVGCRFLSEECIEGGGTVEDAMYFGAELARAGMDFLSLSRGGKFEDAQQPQVGWSAYPYTGPSGYECMPTALSDERGPFGRNLEPAARIRGAVRAAGLETPVVVVGGICSFPQAEEILEHGGADIVGSARQSLADPDWFLKTRLGLGEEVRRCVFSNYCEGLDQKHKQVTCQTWDRLQLDEPGIKKTADGRRRLVPPAWSVPEGLAVGSEPAGLYLAILLKLREPKREVVVVERNPRGNTFGWGVVFSDRTLSYLAEPDPVTYAGLEARLARWQNVDIVHRGEHVLIRGNHFSGIARIALLEVLQRRAEELGVELRFGCELAAEALPEADLIVAADGIRSAVRGRFHDAFQPSLDVRGNRYIWFGTPRLFHALTLTFRTNPDGLFIAHSYEFSPKLSTFIVECDEGSWKRAGLDGASDEESRAYLERVFADDLAGAPLLSNQSRWIQFATVRCRHWSAGNVVLLGDSAHTAHFSIGSGTKLALESAIALADALEAEGDVPTALALYEERRRGRVEALQQAAQSSLEWFETAARDLELSPLAFAFKAMTRSERIDLERLRRRDPEFVAAVERAGLAGETR